MDFQVRETHEAAKNMKSLSSNYIVSMIDNIPVTKKDFNILFTKDWLNDELINYSGRLFTNSNSEVHVWSIFFISTLMTSDNSSMSNWVEKISYFKDGEIIKCRHFIFPVNFKNLHWFMIYANVSLETIYIIDSLNMISISERQLFSQAIYNWLGNYFSMDDWTVQHFAPCPVQKDSFNCGIHVLMNIYIIITYGHDKLTEYCYESSEVHAFRITLAHMILNYPKSISIFEPSTPSSLLRNLDKVKPTTPSSFLRNLDKDDTDDDDVINNGNNIMIKNFLQRGTTVDELELSSDDDENVQMQVIFELPSSITDTLFKEMSEAVEMVTSFCVTHNRGIVTRKEGNVTWIYCAFSSYLATKRSSSQRSRTKLHLETDNRPSKRKRLVAHTITCNCQWRYKIAERKNIFPIAYQIKPVNTSHNHPQLESRQSNVTFKKWIFSRDKVLQIIDQNILFGIQPNFCMSELLDAFHEDSTLKDVIQQLSLVDLRKFMANHAAKIRIGWSTLLVGHLQRLAEENKEFHYTIRPSDNQCNEFRAVLYYIEKQTKIGRGYFHKIHFDGTFNCTWSNLALLNVVVMDPNNHYFVCGSLLYHNNHKKEDDYMWMMEQIRKELFRFKCSNILTHSHLLISKY